MTKSRKIGIYIALALAFVLVLAIVIPLYGCNVNVAQAVTVDSRNEWVNSYDGSYYDNLNTDQVGSEFYDDLASLITKTHTKKISYDDLKEVYKVTDVDPDDKDNVIWFYTGNSVPYTGAMDSGNYPTNREHVWPKMAGRAFPEKSDAGSDAHHVRPLNTKLNNTRSNYQFGEVTQSTGNRVLQSGTYTNYGTNDPDTWCYLSGGAFYPAKGYRGATARILFYLQTRWGNEYGLKFVLGQGNTKTMGDVATLLKWHLEEPPTDEEIRRNEAVFGIQGNRNPFIDHPEYVEMIYCYDGNSYNNKLQEVVASCGSYLENDNEKEAPTGLTLSVSSLDLTVGQSSSKITVTAIPADASNKVVWSSSDSSVATVNAMGVVLAVGQGKATITATSALDAAVKTTLEVNVSLPAVQSLSISPNSLSLTQGKTAQLSVTVSPSGASNEVTWSSSNDNVVTVSQAGLVTAVGEGTATVTVTSAVNSDKTASITVTVSAQQQNAQSAQAFLDSLGAIDAAQSLQTRYNAIQQAINAYNQLSASEKAANESGYQKLQAAMEQYNKDIATINDDYAEATDVALQTMAYRVSVSFMAMVLIVVRRLFGR